MGMSANPGADTAPRDDAGLARLVKHHEPQIAEHQRSLLGSLPRGEDQARLEALIRDVFLLGAVAERFNPAP